MESLTKNMSKLTGVSEGIFQSLYSKEIYCICDEVEESILKDEDITELDVGIGTLYIKHLNKEIQYKFIPNKELEEKLVDTVVNKKSPLKEELDSSLVEKISKTYKELF